MSKDEENVVNVQPDWVLDLERQNANAFNSVRGRYNAVSGTKARPKPDNQGFDRMIARGRKKIVRAPSPEND